jgi:hypothetical protein
MAGAELAGGSCWSWRESSGKGLEPPVGLEPTTPTYESAPAKTTKDDEGRQTRIPDTKMSGRRDPRRIPSHARSGGLGHNRAAHMYSGRQL